MAIHPIPESREEWLKMRANYVTASEVSALLGVQADYQLSPFALYHVKAGNIEAPDIEGERLEWGVDFEDAIARVACRREGWTMSPGAFATDDECPGSSSTLDRIVLAAPEYEVEHEANGFVGPGPLEVKNVDWIAYRDKWIDDEPPPWILIQLQDQLACTGLGWGAVTACIAGNQYYCRRYKRHDGIIAAIRKAKTDFWRMVSEGTPPKPDHYKSTADALRRLHPRPRNIEVDLTTDNELPELCVRHQALVAQRLSIKCEEDAIENQIKAKVKDNERALVAGGIVVTRSVGADTPSRLAKEGEPIKGRSGAHKLTVTVPKDIAA